MSVLVLGGTAEARALCRALSPLRAVVVSLSGATAAPRDHGCETRRGGFGGADGLAAFLAARRIAAVIDATHPFAARISDHAAKGCAAAGVPRLVLRRAPWAAAAGDDWRHAPDLPAALAMVPPHARVFAATGRESAGAVSVRAGGWLLLRAMGRPRAPVRGPGGWVIGPPGRVTDEIALLRAHGITHLVTKNSGGAAGHAKLEAARALRLPVLMVARPPAPPGPSVPSVVEALAWALSLPE